MKKFLFIAFIAAGFISCIPQPTAPLKNTAEYICDEIGWSFRYPDDWDVLSPEEIAVIEGRGKTALESTIEEEIPLTNHNLLWLKKDPFNSFTSTIQPYDIETDGPFGESQEFVTQLMIETYKNQGIETDVKIGKERIDGLEFLTMKVTIYSPDRKKVIMNQIMYDGLINGKTSLTFSINYNNNTDKQALMGIVKTSKFSRRK